MTFVPTPTGERRHEIELQEDRSTRDTDDETGEPVQAWHTYGCEYAAIKPIASAKELIGVKVESKVTHLIKFPYRDDVTDKHKFKYCNRVFEIVGLINAEERDIELWATVTEVPR